MKKRLMVGLLAGGLLAAMLPGVAAAAQPYKGDVEIESPMDINFPLANTGVFTATGPAVDDLILCSSGDVVDLHLKLGGFTPSGKLQIKVTKLFTCDDGSGSFVAKLQVHNDGGTETFTWVILGGDGDYEGLRGRGGGNTITLVPDERVLNLYDGFVIN